MTRIRNSDAFFPAYRTQHETAASVGAFWYALMRGVRMVSLGTGRWSGK